MAVDQTLVGELLIESLLSRLGEEVDLVFQYGSYVKGNTHRYSDYDISYVPAHEDTCDHITVVVDGILCDLYPLHWPRLQNMAELSDPIGPILQHSRVLYRRNEQVTSRFDALCSQQIALMAPAERAAMLRLAHEVFQRVGYDYYLLRTSLTSGDSVSCLAQAQSILTTVFHCLAVLNQRLVDTRKLAEVLALPRLPHGFADAVEAVQAARDARALVNACDRLLQATRDLLLAEQREVHRSHADFATVFGALYPELKNMLQHVVLTCERHDLAAIWGGVMLLYRELSQPLARALTGVQYSGFNSLADLELDLVALGFPALLPAMENRDFHGLREQCLAFDEHLQHFLRQHDVKLYSFDTLDELRAYLATL